ncbi:hypothetical protein ASD11_05870 [Aeromicrobium sp. Root495]|uniref:hypothetical protein n=1 Tax=Aeromicrobium sp. Root495 TaxID=1736550 RepID=UPI0006F9957F|nr:hypothetical protein [Aeromicrobium sp. Root495]KQY59122.1 hypothetical protein ASD11_05870 [Aeromicrobium sp. Root495]RYI99852.1 MAG: hypothetical protein EON52_24950 [Actinomycetales bacterium]
MRSLSTALVLSAVATFVAGAALRAADASQAVLAVAAVTALTWLVSSWSTDEETSGPALASPSALLALLLVGRAPVGTAFAVFTAQVVGAVVGGLGLLALGTDGTLVWTEPTLVATAALAAVVGLLAGWLTLAVEGGQHLAWSAAAPVVAGALLGPALAVTASAGPLVGLAVADLLPWDVALVAAGSALVGTVLGVFSTSVVSRREE